MLGLKEQIEKASLSAISSDTGTSPSSPSLADFSDDDFKLFALPERSQFPVSGAGMEGEGDCHSIRTLQTNHLSPIRRSFGTHKLNCSPIETSPSSPNTTPPTGFETFLAAFEKEGMSEDKSDKHYSLQQELLLTEKIGEMKESDARNLLAKVLVDNLGLRQELTRKERHLLSYKGQMLAILDWKVQETEGLCESKKSESKRPFSVPSTPLSRTSKGKSRVTVGLSALRANDNDDDSSNSSTDSDEIPPNTQGIRMVEEVYGIRRSLSFIQEFASSIEVDQDVLKDRIKGGCYLTNQVLVGSLAGWMTAVFFKKFGKVAISAAGGGLLILACCAKKGYVNVNYDSIYEELSRLCDDPDDDDAEGDPESISIANDSTLSRNGSTIFKSKPKLSQSQSSWSIEKVKSAKRWLSTHTYAVGGYALTFIYHMI